MAANIKAHSAGYQLAATLPQTVSVPRRSNTQAISAALSFLLSEQQDGHWSDFGLSSGAFDVWITAYVLARLGEIPSYFLSNEMRLQIRAAVDWLEASCSPQGAWGHSIGEEADADSTSWAVIALRRYGRKAPDKALDLLQRCIQADGGTATCLEASHADDQWKSSAPEVTALAANALQRFDLGSAEYLNAWMWRSQQVFGCRVPSLLYVFSAILDLGRALVSLDLTSSLRELLGTANADSAFDQALLLRCLLQVRSKRSWWVGVSLRRMQRADGSWPSSAQACPDFSGPATMEDALIFDHKRIFTTVTAVSSLVMAESQPGLYFGSDMPAPRRLHES